MLLMLTFFVCGTWAVTGGKVMKASIAKQEFGPRGLDFP